MLLLLLPSLLLQVMGGILMEESHCRKYVFCLVYTCSLCSFSLEHLPSLALWPWSSYFFALPFRPLWIALLKWLPRFALALSWYESMKWKINMFGFGSFIQSTNIKKIQLILMLLWVSIYSIEVIIWNKSLWKICLIQVFSRNH